METTVAKLTELKHEVVVRDLYEMKFNPVLAAPDFIAFKAGQTPPDIAEEQKHIVWCDAMVFVYPLWWTGLPALVKGYIDRVFSLGFAYQVGPTGIKGLLAPKKVLVFQTQGNTKEAYEKAVWPAMNVTSDFGIFEFCAMTMIDHVYFPSVPFVTPEVRAQYLQAVADAITKIH